MVRALLQIYPESPAQAEMLVSAAMRAGFTGGMVIDYPHSSRAKKCGVTHAYVSGWQYVSACQVAPQAAMYSLTGTSWC